jgi:hypothetical protein
MPTPKMLTPTVVPLTQKQLIAALSTIPNSQVSLGPSDYTNMTISFFYF